MSEIETTIVWEAPVIIKPEFRLYYNDTGRVVCYTCEKLEGNYVVIDALTFAQSRPDVRVVDGRLSTVSTGSVVSKLIRSNSGARCAAEDISILVDEDYTGDITKWELKTYEL
jgi:hypothetical protein